MLVPHRMLEAVVAFVPQRMLSPASVAVPHKIDCALAFVPHKTESPYTELVFQMIDRLPKSDGPFGTRTTFPLRSISAPGDIALPIAAGDISLLASAALMSRYPAPTVKMSAWR